MISWWLNRKMTATAHLLLLDWSAQPRLVPLREGETKVGTAPDCTVRVSDAEVEPHHFSILRRADGFLLERESSSVLVNGRRVRQRQLEPFDLITLGRSAIIFRPGAPRALPVEGFSEPQRAVAICRKLHEFVRRLSAGDSIEAMTEQLLSDLVYFAEADRALLLLYDGEDFRSAAEKARTIGEFDVGETQLSRTLTGKILAEKKPFLWCSGDAEDALTQAPSLQDAKVASLMCAPIQDGSRLLGALYLSRKIPKAFDADSLDLLMLYASQAALLLAGSRRTAEVAARASLAEEKLEVLQGRPFIGSSAAIQSLMVNLTRIANSDISVLLTGETGTGKELLAQEIHRRSQRAKGPFVTVHCGAIPEALLESELFGHVRGAFTSANRDRIGQIRSAQGGTLFFDELGEMPLSQQAKLLRVLEDGRVQPVGDDRHNSVDFRLVCATHRNLEALVADGRFRQDLYFRISAMSVEVPALRERGEDSIELAHFFLQRDRIALTRPKIHFAPDALKAMRQYEWPGNVRELQTAVRRGVLLSDAEVLEAQTLGLPISGDQIKTLAEARDEFLKQYVERAVDRLGGNRTRAAELLQVSPRTIFKYLDEV